MERFPSQKIRFINLKAIARCIECIFSSVGSVRLLIRRSPVRSLVGKPKFGKKNFPRGGIFIYRYFELLRVIFQGFDIILLGLWLFIQIHFGVLCLLCHKWFNPTYKVQKMEKEAFQNASFKNASFPNRNKGNSCLRAECVLFWRLTSLHGGCTGYRYFRVVFQ